MPESFTGGFVQTNGYLIETPEGGHVLVDAPSGVAEWLARKEIRPVALLLTHQHFDHVEDAAEIAALGIPIIAREPYSENANLAALARSWGLPVQIRPFEVTQVLGDSAEFDIGGLHFGILHVPGHSPDSIAFHLAGNQEVYGGDTLMADNIGRSDLPGGDEAELQKSIRGKLFALPAETRVFPGHGPATTIGAERAGNPCVRS